MEQQISLESVSELSVKTLQRLEAAQTGFPLARYEIRPQLIRKVKLLALICLVLSITLTFAVLILFLVVSYQLLVLSQQHPTDLYRALQQQEQISDIQFRLLAETPSLLIGFMLSIAAIWIWRMLKRELPTAILICTEALVVVRTAKIDVIRWNEIKSLVKMPTWKERNRYILTRTNRKQLVLGEASYEQLDELISQIRQRAVFD